MTRGVDFFLLIARTGKVFHPAPKLLHHRPEPLSLTCVPVLDSSRAPFPQNTSANLQHLVPPSRPSFQLNTATMAGLPHRTRLLYYNGAPQPSSSGKTFHSIDPSTGKPLAAIHSASASDVDAAVASAAAAFPAWSATPAAERARVLLRAVALLRARNDELARVETADTGKPFSETSGVDVVTGADVLEYYAHMVGGGGLNGETAQLREDAWVYGRKEALGVCVGIGAWNYPIQMWVLRA